MFAWVLRLGRLMGFWLCLSVGAATVLGTGTVWLRHQGRAEEARRAVLHAREEELLAGMDRLAAEWSRLNRPERLTRLARKYLDLGPRPISRPADLVDVLGPGGPSAGAAR